MDTNKAETMGIESKFVKIAQILAVLVLVVLAAAPVAQAHKVTVFAWVDGDTVHTQSKFSGGRRAKQATIEVYDAGGDRLLIGKTDDNGEFSFKIPKASALKVVLIAGMGHQNAWQLSDAEIRQGLTVAGSAPAAPPASASGSPAPAVPVLPAAPQRAAAAAGCPCLSAEAVQRIVEQTLDRKLQPVVSLLAETRQEGPTLQDVLGGLGYILGLVGLGAFIHARRLRDRP